MFALRPKATTAFPPPWRAPRATAMAQSTFGHGVDSRGLAVAGDRMGMLPKKADHAAALARLAGKFGARPLLLVCLAVLADGLPAVKAACAQAMLEGVRDQPA